LQNGYTTKTGLPSTNAETAYKYLFNPNYKHLHFALEDCFSELEIYKAIKSRKTKWLNRGNYREVQRKMKNLVN
jgi:hypothetical protein